MTIVVMMVCHLFQVKELDEEEQLLWVELALVETMVGMALYLPVEAVEELVKLVSNLTASAPVTEIISC